MSILPKQAIVQLLNDGWILVDPIDSKRKIKLDSDQVQPASVDLRIGIIFRKNKRISDTEMPEEQKDSVIQYEQFDQVITLSKGEIVTILTYEAVRLPNNITATLFPINSLSVEGVLILNTGHVDPGYTGRITIRLINLKETPLPLRIGQKIFTMTLHMLVEEKIDLQPNPISILLSNNRYNLCGYDKNITDQQFIDIMRMKVAGNMGQAVFDVYATKLAQEFKENYISRLEFESKVNEVIKKIIIRYLATAVSILVTLSVLVAAIPAIPIIYDWLQKNFPVIVDKFNGNIHK